MKIKTEFNFVLPRGYVDEAGTEKKIRGTMRLLKVKDLMDINRDSRVKASASYYYVVLLAKVVTGLSEITSVTCSLAGSPTINHHMSTVASGSVAGTIVISSWKPTSTSNPTPVAACGSFVNVNWIAVGL